MPGMKPPERERKSGSLFRQADAELSVPFEWGVGLLWLVLLWAWIKPIAVMSGWTEPGRTVPLFAAVGIAVLLDMLRAPAWAGVPLKGASVFLAVGWLFRGQAGGHSGLGADWWREYASLFSADIYAVFSGQPGEISPETRTLIFLAGWVILAGVIQSILVYRKRALWLNAVTWLYLAGLQLWPGLDTTGEMFASGAAGLALMGLLQLDRLRNTYATGLLKRTRTDGDHGRIIRLQAQPAAIPPGLYAAFLGLSLLLFAGALAGTGRGEGAMKPLRTDWWGNVAHLFSSGSSLAGPDTEAVLAMNWSQTGYGYDDSRLGGPLAISDEPVFTARTPVATYWRGESKSYYDGLGWHTGATGESGDIGLAGAAGAVTQEIMYQGSGSLDILLAGGAIEKVEFLYTVEGKQLSAQALTVNAASGKYQLAPGWGALGYARMQVSLDSRLPEELLAASGTVPEEIARTYLQLPDSLPERVRRLAEETTRNGTTFYAKALLLKSYLQQHYRYSLTEVPLRQEGRDFVDTFLFGGNAGYCDYFSTSYAVMLRAVGIPARWVKGFAPGAVTAEEEGVKTVEVSSKDAHSWVEVYIPSAGWVSVDPTPSFSGFAGQEAEGLESLRQTVAGQEAEQGGKGFWSRWSAPDLAAAWSAVRSGLNRLGDYAAGLAAGYRLLLAALALVPVPLFYLLRPGSHLWGRLQLLGYRPRGRHGAVRTVKLLNGLWLTVFRQYGHPAAGQTLREYALATGEQLPHIRLALLELVLLYEKVRYSREETNWVSRGKISLLWRQLLKSKPSGSSSPGGGTAAKA